MKLIVLVDVILGVAFTVERVVLVNAPSYPLSLAEDAGNFDSSEGLTKADIAWHALNTYGWDCEEVIKQDEGWPGFVKNPPHLR
ncbi:hypothetical protein KM864_18700 (plasmid) [Ralstonia solanacearum]|nr:hypothetical protein KM864_18700 [Ralstonia solanacearum]